MCLSEDRSRCAASADSGGCACNLRRKTPAQSKRRALSANCDRHLSGVSVTAQLNGVVIVQASQAVRDLRWLRLHAVCSLQRPRKGTPQLNCLRAH